MYKHNIKIPIMICLFSLLLVYSGKSYPVLTFLLCSVVFILSIVTFSLSDKHLTKLRIVDCGNGLSVVLSKEDETVIIGCGGTEFLARQGLQHKSEHHYSLPIPPTMPQDRPPTKCPR